jgi:NADH dehydrogenase [ubiquinone] 1 alpha subcomplex assembly factor 6
MRFKFWEDTIAKLYDKSCEKLPDQPVVRELKRLLSDDSKKLTKRYFDRLITARSNSTNFSFITIKQLEDYCENSVSSVYYLLLENRSLKNLNIDHAASHLGKAQGLVNVLRSVPKQQRASNLPVPQELLMKHGVSQERVFRDKLEDKGVEDCIFELASVANQHLEKVSLSKWALNLAGKRTWTFFLKLIFFLKFIQDHCPS